MKILRSILIKCSLLFIIFLSFVIFLLTTTPGLYTLIKLASYTLPGTLALKELQGRFIDKLYFKELIYDDHNIRYRFKNVHLQWKPIQFLWNHVSIDLLKAEQVFIDVKKKPQTVAKTEKIEHASPNLPFQLTLKRLAIKKLRIQQSGVRELFSKIGIRAEFTHEQWNIIGNATLKTPVAGRLSLQARWQKAQQLTMHSLLNTIYGDLEGTLTYDELKHPKYQGEVKTKGLRFVQENSTLREAQLAATFKGDDFYKPDAQLQFTARYFDQFLRGELRYGEQLLNGKVELGANQLVLTGSNVYQWVLNFRLNKPELLHPSLQGVQTSILGSVTVNNPQSGNLMFTISPGTYRSPQDKNLPPIPFQGGQLKADLTAQQLEGLGHFTIDSQKILKTTFRLPKFSLNAPKISSQTLIGALYLNINSLEFLQGASKDIDKPQGKISATLSVNGTVKNPNVQGMLTLTNGNLILPKLNLHLTPIQASLKSQNKQWKIEGLIAESGHSLTVEGEGVFSPNAIGRVTLEGSHFPLMKTAEYTIDISPKLTIHFKPQLCEIYGTILVPKAELKPISLSSTVNLSEDAVFVKKEPESHPIPRNVTTDVDISMGQEVAVKVKGLQGFLEGTIHVKQVPQGEPYAVGELSMRDGKYQAYGQKLSIEQGQLLFSGGALDNPGVRIRAVRSFSNANTTFSGSNQLFDFNPDNLQTFDFNDKTTVGIEVSGRLNSTKIKLFSIPPTLSQANILSMLILGRPASQANKSGGQLLLTALSSMNLDSGTKGMQLLDQLKQTLGFDVDVQSTSEYNQKKNQMNDGTSFVVGKALTNRLYLSYNIGLLQADANVLTLKYLLNQFFSIQVTTSDSGSGADVIYTHST